MTDSVVNSDQGETPEAPAPPNAQSRRAGIIVCILASIVALVSARDYAGGWNDGSRLATVETLVDQHTLTIDRSPLVQPPSSESIEPNPYPADKPDLQRNGTKDKLFINGRYYSYKSPVPALTLAGVYKALQRVTEIDDRRQT